MRQAQHHTTMRSTKPPGPYFNAAIIRFGAEDGIKVSELVPARRRFSPVETTPNTCYSHIVPPK